jgi:N-acetylmuramoyl-L-alanine amidase-like protein
MSEVWYSKALKIQGNSGGSWVSGYSARGVLHTTEGSKATGAFSAYSKSNSWPHFTVGETGKVYQHVGVDVASRALKNPSGGVETNRARCIQIEIVGFASRPQEHSKEQIEALKGLMRWIEANTGVKPLGPGRPFASKYGQLGLRFSNIAWKTFEGWCGHCHVPENDHWDPGLIDLQSLLKSDLIVGTPVEVDVQLTPVQLNIVIDQNGRGWTWVPYTVDKILSVKAHSGTRPGVDGLYDSTPDIVAVTPDGDGTVVVVQGGNTGGTAPVWLQIIE